MSTRKGFTLIELLVVIAIIALLLAITMPGMQKAKEMAKQIPCMANQRTLAQAFYMYQEDNSGVLPYALIWDETLRDGHGEWVLCPAEELSSGAWAAKRGAAEATLEYELNGIKNGTFWPYIEAEDAYHCPGDNRVVKNGIGFRSYSMPATIGWRVSAASSQMTPDIHVAKMHQIKSPGDRYVFVEENERIEDGWGWNCGSWVINEVISDWFDPIAPWHTKGSTLGFADGHAEKIKWADSRTIDWLQNGGLKGGNAVGRTIDHKNPTMSEDLDYMLRALPKSR